MTNDISLVGQHAGRLIPQLAAKLKAEAQRAGTLHPSTTQTTTTKSPTGFVGRRMSVSLANYLSNRLTPITRKYYTMIHSKTDAVPGVSVICASA
jgi:hypothetical protein